MIIRKLKIIIAIFFLPNILEANTQYFNEADYYISRVLSGVDFRAKNLEAFDSLENSSIDLYASYKSLYLQNRDNLIMKVGLFLTNQQFLDTDMVAALDDQIAMVHHARDFGWDTLLSGQHYLNEGNNQQLQLVPFLARLIPEAGDMNIALGILLLNLHNPVYTAETVASLDVISRGKLIFGVGLGYRDVEFDAFAVPRGKRVARFEEYLELIQKLWTEDNVTHRSETCTLNNVRMNIRPIQQLSLIHI